MDSNPSGRRRGIGFVTPNACIECKKKRTKCDGKSPCGRCASLAGIQCVYEVPTRQTKDDMRKQIARLQARQRQADHVLNQLTSQKHSEEVLYQLQNGESLEAIANRLRRLSAPPANVTTYTRNDHRQAIQRALAPAQSTGNMALPSPEARQMQDQRSSPSGGGSNAWPGIHMAPSEALKNSSQVDEMNWAMDMERPANSNHNPSAVGVWHQQPRNADFDNEIQLARDRGQDVLLGGRIDSKVIHEYHVPTYTTQRWTTITSDAGLIEHLLALYFCWEYPIFASLSKEHFMEDFRSGNPRYSSPLLVNALLAVACRFTERLSIRSDPVDSATAGDHFFAEALRLYDAEEDHRVLTTIQALGIMSIRQASCGRVSEGIFFSGQSMRLAMEMGLQVNAEEGDEYETEVADEAVRSATFWGAFALDEAWSLCSAALPFLSRKTILEVKPAIIQRIEAASWVPYTDDGAPLEENCMQPSNIRSVYKTFCELSEIIHRTLYTLYTPGRRVTSRTLLDAYNQYIVWYDTIPDTLRLGQNFTPAVLFAHLYYHLAILLLFRPFVRLCIIASDVSPRDVCIQASKAISAIIQSYSNLYTLRRTPSFVPYFVLGSTIFHLDILLEDVSNEYSKDQFLQNVRDLKEMSGCHGFAARALEVVNSLAYSWKMMNILVEMHHGNDLQNLSYPSSILDDLYPLRGGVLMVESMTQDSALNNRLLLPLFTNEGVSIAVGAQNLEQDGFKILGKHEKA